MIPILAAVRFSLARLGRNVRYLVFAVAMPLGFYLLYSHMYGVFSAFSGTTWAAYFMVSMATFGAIGTTLNAAGTQTALDRNQGWTRLLRLTPLPSWAYAAGQVTTAMAASLLVVFLVLAAAHFASSLPLTAREFEACLAVWLGSLVFSALGLTLAVLLDASTVGYGTMILYLGTGFLGGLWTPLKVLPPVFSAIASWMPSFRMADIAWHILAGKAPPLADLGVLALYLAIFGTLASRLYARRA